MKNMLANISIKRKLIFLILSVTLMAMGSFFSVLIFNHHQRLYTDLIHHVDLNAKFIGEYCISPFEVEDANGANDLLRKIQNLDYIENATLYTNEMKEFASFNKYKEFAFIKYNLNYTGVKDYDDFLISVTPIVYQNHKYGTLVLKVSKDIISKNIITYIVYSSFAFIIVFFLAIVFAERLQRIISNPILDLSSLSNSVSKDGNYSIRAIKKSEDEIGILYDAFNNMLKQIKLREDEKNLVLQTLKDREAEKSGILKSAPIGIGFLSNREFKWANDNMALIAGYEINDILYKSVKTLYKDENEFNRIGNFINNNLIDNDLITIETVWKHKSGKLIDVSLNISKYSSSSEYNDVIVTAMDITENKRNLSALKESEDKFRKLFESLNEGVVILELYSNINEDKNDFKFVEINKSFETQMDIDKSGLIGKSFKQLTAKHTPHLFEKMSQIVEYGEGITPNLYIEELNKYFYASAISFKNNLFAIIFVDVTEEIMSQEIISKQIADLESKNAEMERFTYTVSHDLRSPLITIKGFSGIINKNLQNEEFEKITPSIKKIESAASKMDELLNDLLELSRIGRMINPASSFSMNEAVKESIELLHGIITQNNVSIKVDENMPPVFGDKMRIKEIYQNLIENAIKFSKPNENCNIEIGFRNQNNSIEYFVKDNGIGIDPKYHTNIFGLFNKLDQNTGGSGIGLALIKRIIELHEGEIKLESELGLGATFYFTIKSSPERRII